MRPPSLKQLVGLVVGLLLTQLSAPVAAQPLSRSGASIHDHSTAAKGGTTLAPKILTMLATSTATFLGPFSIVDSSSMTIIPAGTTTAGTCNVCRATVTLVNYGNFDMAVEHFGSVQGGGAGNMVHGFYLINGGYYNGQSSSVAAFGEETGFSNSARMASWKDVVPRDVLPSTGTISVCFGYATNSATVGTWPSNYGTLGHTSNKLRVSFPISK